MPSILVIDENTGDLIALKRAFNNAGVSNPLLPVRSNEEARRYLGGAYPYNDRMQYPLPSVILLDLIQPGGFDLLAWIRQKFPNGGLLVVALTRLEEIRKITRAYSLGANSFLTKPVNVSELRELISIFSGYWLLNGFRHNEQEKEVVKD